MVREECGATQWQAQLKVDMVVRAIDEGRHERAWKGLGEADANAMKIGAKQKERVRVQARYMRGWATY